MKLRLIFSNNISFYFSINLIGFTPFSLIPVSTAFDIPGSKIGLTADVETWQLSKIVLKRQVRKLSKNFSANVKGVVTFKNAHSFWLIEDTMRLLIQGGIPQYIKRFIILFCFKESRQIEISEPKVFSVDDLAFGFVVWLVACSIAIAGFLCELMWFYGKNGFTNIVGLYCFTRFFVLQKL